MFRRLLRRCGELSPGQLMGGSLLLGLCVELLTSGLRFGCGWTSTRDTAVIGQFTLGLRIHHAYVGVALGLLAWWCPPRQRGLGNLLLIVALALVASDLAHHFLVLWPLTGSPQFDLVYPPQAASARAAVGLPYGWAGGGWRTAFSIMTAS